MTSPVCHWIFWKPANLFADFRDRYLIRSMPSEYSMLSGGPHNQDKKWMEPWLNLTRLQISSALKMPSSFVHSQTWLVLCARCEDQQENRWTYRVRMLFFCCSLRLECLHNTKQFSFWWTDTLWYILSIFNLWCSREPDIVHLQNIF